MYVPSHFAETRVEVLHQLMRAHPLATLVTLTSEGLNANHIPMLLDPDPVPFGKLCGHVARANNLWRDVSPAVEALAIFQGPEAYITPSWYQTKQETGKVVPTWNYAVVHAYGTIRVIEEQAWLRALVERLTDEQEAKKADPWQVADAPRDYVDGLLPAIVGIEISLTRLQGKWKMSQNQNEANRAGVINGLRQTDDAQAHAMADLIKQ